MSTKDAWLNIAQAAQWLAEGREVESLHRNPLGGVNDEWEVVHHPSALHTCYEYRLKPKPREWTLELRPGHPTLLCATHGPCNVRPGEVIRVREVIEP